MHSDLKQFIHTYLKQKGFDRDDLSLEPLRGDGSKRLFWRISLPDSNESYIAVSNPPLDGFTRKENLAYLKIGKHLHEKSLPLPAIYQWSLEKGLFVIEDMGRSSLQERVSTTQDPLPLYEKILEHLFRLQVEGAKGFKPEWCCQTGRYDRRVMIQFESHYFRDAFLHGYLGLKREWPELECSFDFLADSASQADSRFFLHRDFQSRNIMVSQGKLGIIDWQGGRLGPLGYDLASLLIDPYTALPEDKALELYGAYLRFIGKRNRSWVGPFEKSYPYLAVQRNLQILGAFGYLTKRMKKPYFETYIPRALTTLRTLLSGNKDSALLPLKKLIHELEIEHKDQEVFSA